MIEAVSMLDLEDKTLHRPSATHLVTVCGVGPLDHCQVGPTPVVRVRAERLCPECWSITCPKCGRTSHHPDDVEAGYCGACHVYRDQLLAFRVYVDNRLVDERWVDPMSEPGDETTRMAVEQRKRCEAADAAGVGWRLEIYDPAEDRTVRLSGSEDQASQPPPPGQRHVSSHGQVDIDEPGELLRALARLLGYS
jgi:hypothetical protein